jgi:hypothetical protein
MIRTTQFSRRRRQDVDLSREKYPGRHDKQLVAFGEDENKPAAHG